MVLTDKLRGSKMVKMNLGKAGSADAMNLLLSDSRYVEETRIFHGAKVNRRETRQHNWMCLHGV